MHKYFARKPANVVKEYIEAYSKKGDTVLDPFNGSGVTVLESIKLGRKAIGVDVSPFAIFLTQSSADNVNIDLMQKTFYEMKEDLLPKINKLYKTTCSCCKNHNAIIMAVRIKENKLNEIEYSCQKCGDDKIIKKFDSSDRKNHARIEREEIKYWTPDVILHKNGRINITKYNFKVTDLFSHRNLIALSMIHDAIRNINDKEVQQCFRLVFSSALPQFSKLLGETSKSGSSWKLPSFWVPKNRHEKNVWHYFETRFKKVIKGKMETNDTIGPSKRKNLKLYQKSATDLSFIPDNSIDYIFADPPYGDSVPYLELNRLWSAWLDKEPNFDDEIVISDSPERKIKNEENYDKSIRRAFKELYRVLKPDKYMTITFHNTDVSIYNIIIRAALVTGFELEKSVYQPPAVVSVKAKLAPYASAVGDYYIRFKKPIQTKAHSEDGLDKKIYENIIVQAVTKIIAERGEPTAYAHILNSYSNIYAELKKRGHLFTADEDIYKILEKYIGKNFVIQNERWWIKDPKSVRFLNRVPLSERVEAVIIDKLNSSESVHYDDILRSLYLTFPNAFTPDTVTVKDVLENYADKKNGKWRSKSTIKTRRTQHDTIVNDLCSIGIKCGFNVYGDTKQYKKPLNFDMNQDKIKRVSEIDVIWHNDEKIVAIFEVENSTGITEAFVRGSNIEYPIKRVIVIPDERESLLVRKIKEPMIMEHLASDEWLFIRYDTFFKYYENNKKKRKLDPESIFSLHKPPAEKTQTKLA